MTAYFWNFRINLIRGLIPNIGCSKRDIVNQFPKESSNFNNGADNGTRTNLMLVDDNGVRHAESLKM